MISSKNWLRIGYWNIHNVFNDGIAKTEDENVLNTINRHDIFCLSEIHCAESDVPNVEGYGCFKICRGVSKRINRYFGGIAVYYKKSIRKGIKFIKCETDFIWLKLCKTFLGIEQDVYVCLAYIPPEYDNYYKNRGIDSVSLIENEIIKLEGQGSIILMGDINARTGNSFDYIKDDCDKGIDIDWYRPDFMSVDRTSEDRMKPCTRGNKLLQLCKSARLRILNGRTIGDACGLFTCFKENGNSVIDYMLTNEENVKNIAYFQVGNFDGSISDHCFISSAIRINQTHLSFESSDGNVRTPFPVMCICGIKIVFLVFKQHLTIRILNA